MTTFDIPHKTYNFIRQINLNGLTTGGEKSLPFMHSELKTGLKQLVAIEIFIDLPNNYSEILKQAWGNCINDPVEWAKEAVKRGADILAVRFNITENTDLTQKIQTYQEKLKQILDAVSIPVIILGSDKRDIDRKLLSALAVAAFKKCTIGIIDEDNYKSIIPVLKEHGHNVISRTPIDINLAKQLNILMSELGFELNNIIIDPNIGGLGYGLDYAYSVIERIRIAGLEGDNMLNMPIIAFVGEESWKTKEAKSSVNTEGWGDLTTRAISWECLTASSMLTAGADIVVLYHPDSVKYIKNFINNA